MRGRTDPRFNLVVDHADARAIAAVAPNRASRWRRRRSMLVLLVAFPLTVAIAALVWVEVARTLRNPDPLFVPKPPVVSGVVWSDRVFVDRAAFRRWLAARHLSYVEWERAHPNAAALLHSKPAAR
jgi:hypothetical protein